MVWKGKKWIWMISGGILLAGCGVNMGASPTPNVDTTPVTLSLYLDTGAPDQFVQDDIVKPVETKYPYVTLNVVTKGQGTQIEDLVAQNSFPDLAYTSPPWFTTHHLIDLGLTYDLTPMINKYHMDLSKFNARIIDQLKLSGKQGELDALPFYINYTALFYNKDVFDKLGIAYPKDGMTWDQVLQLAKQMSKTVDGTGYQGFLMPGAADVASELTLPYVDSKTNQSLLNTDSFKQIYQLYQQYHDISNPSWVNNATNKNSTLAMWTAWGDQTQTFVSQAKSGQVMNWDMVTEPVFSSSSGNAVRVDSHDLMISSNSQHKDAAFQVISYLVSKEYQTQLVKDGYVSPLTDPELQNDYAANIPELKGKNLQAIFKSKPAPIPTPTQYDNLVQSELNKHSNDVTNGVKDVNTALREANDAANQDIQNAMQTQGK